MTQIHNEIAFTNIVKLQQYWMPIALIISILILLIWLRFKMTNATQIHSPNPFRTIEQLATAIGELLGISKMGSSSSSSGITSPPDQIPSSTLSSKYLQDRSEVGSTSEEAFNRDIDKLLSKFRPELIQTLEMKYLQEKSEIGVIFQEGFDIKHLTIRSFPAFIQALEMTDRFVTEFWEEFPLGVQENLKTSAATVLELFPAIDGEANYVKLLMPLLNEVRKRPLRILKSLWTLRRPTAEKQKQENLLKNLAQNLQQLALSIEGLGYADELKRTHPTTTAAQILASLKEFEGRKRKDLKQRIEILLKNASDIES